MKKIMTIMLCLLFGLSLYAEPVNSMLGADGIEMSEDVDDITAQDYIQEGLVLHFDAIENVCYGLHEPLAVGWFDHVSGNTYEFSNGAMLFSDAAFIKTDSANTILETANQIDDVVFSDSKTYEIGFRIYHNNTFETTSNTRIFSFAGSAYNALQDRMSSLVVYFDGMYMYDRPSSEGTISFTRDGSSLSSFFNANIFWTKSMTNPRYPQSGNIQFSCMPNGRLEIRFVRVYSRALTPEEIAYNHQIDIERFGL